MIDFTDGFDALFVRVNAEFGAPDPVAATIAEFESINERRTTVLTALRRHASASRIAVSEQVDRWQLQFEGNASSEIYVGPVLTRLVEQYDAAEALQSLVENHWLPKLNLEAARKLIDESSPIQPVIWRAEAETVPLFGPGILALDCKALEGDDPLPRDPSQLVQKLAPTLANPGQQVVNQLVERIGRHRFSFELMGKGDALLEFADKHDHFKIHPRSKRLAAEVGRNGIDATVERLAAEYRRQDAARGRALALVQAIMADAGYVLDDQHYVWWFGHTHRLAELKVGRALTLALRTRAPETLVRDWLENAHLLPNMPSVEELRSRTAPEQSRIRRKYLPRSAPAPGGYLSDLLPVDSVSIDQQADEAIQVARRQAEMDPGRSQIGDYEDPFALWAGPFWYRTGDAWATDQWWLNLARAAWEKHQRQLAAVLMMFHGEQPAGARFVEMFHEHQYWESEAFEDALLWRFVDELPWCIDEGELPKFPMALGPRPPQVIWRAARKLQSVLAGAQETRTAGGDELATAMKCAAELDSHSVGQWLTMDQLTALESATREWIRRSDFSVGPELGDLCAAAAGLGWTWVPDELGANPAFVTAQFQFEDQYAEPGLIALRLSWIRPCELVARFAARALAGLTAAQFEARARRIAGSDSLLESGGSIVQNLLIRDRYAGAIAWQRCRARQ